MSILVKPVKRKLHELEGLEEQNRRRFAQRHDVYDSTPLISARSIAGVLSHDESLCATATEPETQRGTNSDSTSQGSLERSFQTNRIFTPNSSIVLIGIRGTGKSSLAVILAATSGRRLIDADRYFQHVTGHSRATFKKSFGLTEYRRQDARVMESVLAEHSEGWVIVCGPGFMEQSGQMLLREYAKTHPVIHIVRDPESIQSYLKAWDANKIRRFLELSGPIYRDCSNFEFFNVSERTIRDGPHTLLDLEVDQRHQPVTPFLTLKRLQRDFLRFIAFATGDPTDLSNHLASFPLSMQPVETRTFTYAVSVPISSFFERDLDIEDLESTADAFELKVDVGKTSPGDDPTHEDRISHIVAMIRRNIVVPLIYHVDSIVGSEAPRRPVEQYLSLVQHGLRLAPEFLTVDLSYDNAHLLQIISSKGSSKVIGHYAALESRPGGWDNAEFQTMYERAQQLGCDMVRLTQPAASIEDNFSVERFRHRITSLPTPSLPLIAYNSSSLGRLSCCFNPILTPVVHQSLAPEIHTKGLPCITLREAQGALYTSFALDPMQFFVFGANVTYSLSPAMHNAAYRASGLPHTYNLHQSSSLRGLNELVENPHFGGTSVSLPYKTEVIPLLHSMSPHARAIGAVNTLIPIRKFTDTTDTEGSSLYMEKSRAGPIKALHGDNTDWIGMCNCFRRGLSPANAIRPSSTGVVIGAGGMARAAVYSLIHLGVQNIFVWNRTVANAEKLAYHYNRQNLRSTSTNGSSEGARVHILHSLDDPWPEKYKQPTVICSCIPQHSIGNQPAPNFEIPPQWLESPTGGVVVELAYKPLYSPLIKQMRGLSHRGWVTLDGLDVLPEQGFAQFELFTGRRAPRRLMRAVVLQEYKGEEGQYFQSAIQSRLENLDGQPT
ncbi:putative quinate pathway repressor protein QutR [Aspergillus candidus]|uniref:Putative quinate pathway repressor protein QutR n=1 Tax=Aspergillus candidus TaxID=41067 RepID=A0A2I2F490_ASPCN|nr:putative quinate pathway repressor protein QutR [Aspergillus candidus]PLB35445.1 putative quinate pathway repressor protein QutR [Aspergillus candidus]